MAIAVLGPLQVDGQENGLSPRDRVVLSAMVVRAGDPISREVLADALWGEQLPVSWSKVVQGCVVRLRKLLGGAAIESGTGGYRLTLNDDELDHRQFERLLARAREAMAGGDPARAAYLVQEALTLWRGPALPDVEEWEPGRVEANRLAGLRMEAEELRVEAEIGAGRATSVLEQARALVAQAPFREKRWALLAMALHQAGRQAEALGAVKRARSMLVDELGIDPGRDLIELEQLLLRQDPSLDVPAVRDVSAVCPYRGLLPYDAADADSFFGREEDVAACLRRLRDSGVLAVVGPSGIGKSSLVRAGVVASLVRNGTPVLVTTPGRHPLDSLTGLKPHGRQTLVVDQTEEAVTLCADPEEQRRYFGALTGHVAAGGRLVLSLRADHIGDLSRYADMARLVEDGLYLLGPMSDDGLRRAIEDPAHRAGLRFEAGLVDLLVRDVEGEPAALPMLSHVLRGTWERREGPTLTVDGYRATGGIRDAVSRSAERLYDSMDESQRGRLRSLLLRLVMPTEDGEAVRTRVPRAKVATDEEHLHLVEQLVDARLVSIDGDSVQIAHEALVRVWPRLRTWLDDDVEGQRLFQHLAGAADAWESMGRPDSELYRGARLGRTLEWRDRTNPDLSGTEAAFLAAAVNLSESELRAAKARVKRERRVNRRLRAALAGIAVLLVLALVAGVAALRSADQAQQDRDRAEHAAILAEAKRAGGQALTSESIDTSLLLAAEALSVDKSPQAWENLTSTLARAGSLQQVQQTGEFPVSVAASGDGALVAVSRPIGGLRLFDAKTLAPMPFHDDTPASAVAFSPDGTLLAVAVNQWVPSRGQPIISSQPVHLYDLPDAELADRQLGGWPAGANIEYSLAFSRDGTRIVAGVNRWDQDRNRWNPTGALMVWDVANPERPVLKIPVPDLPVAALSPDGDLVYLATTGARPLRVYDVDRQRLLDWAGSDQIGSSLNNPMDISPDGSTLAITTADRIQRFDTKRLQPVGPAMRGHNGDIKDVEYSHDGSMLLSNSVDRSAIVWDTDNGAVLQRLSAHSDETWGGAFGPDDKTAYTVSGDEDLMSWDVTGARELWSTGKATDPSSVSRLGLPAPDGRTVARSDADRIWFVDNRTGRQTSKARTTSDVWTSTWSPDSHWLLTTGPGVLSLWDARNGGLVDERRYERGTAVLAVFSPDSEQIHVENGYGVVETLDRSTLRRIHPWMRLGGTVVMTLLAQPRDASVIAVRQDGSYVRFDPESHLILDSVEAGFLGRESEGAALSPDGSTLLTVRPDGLTGLLDLDTHTWLGEGFDTDKAVTAVYAPDGRQFAIAGADRIKLWDGATGAYQASLPLPIDTADVSMSYQPDSGHLLVVSSDGRVWTVDTQREDWFDRACAIAGRNLTRDEWSQYFPSRPYEITCPQWPADR